MKHAYILSHQIHNLCDILLKQDQVILFYSIFDKIQLVDLDEKELHDLVDIILKFSNLYSFKYELYYYNDMLVA